MLYLIQFGGIVLLLMSAGFLALSLLTTWKRYLAQQAQFKLSTDLLNNQLVVAKKVSLAHEARMHAWNGIRKFQVSKKVSESDSVTSFYLIPHDKKAIPTFYPGQYLTFELNIPGQNKKTIRCYSLSNSYQEDHYRISVKKILPPANDVARKPGLVSSYFHEQVKEGDILDVKVPSGQFYLETSQVTPVVLIAGGIGITPMLSMLNHIIASGVRREVWLFYGSRNGGEHLFKEALNIAERDHEHVHIQICYSRPGSKDALGKDYHHAERVSGALLKKVLPSNNFDFYLCGPGEFMQALTDDLKEWGVPETKIHFEAFGPSSVKKSVSAPAQSIPVANAPRVSFSRSQKEVDFTQSGMSLLELAEAHGVVLPSGCRAGSCGTCLTAIKEGEVEYLKEPGFDAESGTCLTCICKPKGNRLVLDA